MTSSLEAELATNGGSFDKYHLARPIEDIKARARRTSRAEQKLKEAVEVLEPFGTKYEDIIPDKSEIAHGSAHPDDMPDEALSLITVPVGHLRRARAFLASLDKEVSRA